MSGAGVVRQGEAAARGRALNGALWVLQAAVAVQFAAGGFLKITGSPEMVAMFVAIGAGQPLRYLVGALEIAGAVGLLLPRRASLAALGLAALMVGAAATNVLALGLSPVFPLALLALNALIAWGRR